MQEQKLLDELEDAKEEIKHCRRGWAYIIAAFIICVLFILTGLSVGMWSTANHIDLGGQAAGFLALGIIGTIATTITSFSWLDRYGHLNSPKKALKSAERAYRDHLMGQD
jgi:hypothetical protein